MDTVDKATRSRIMRAIKSKDTKPELALRGALIRARIGPWSRNAPNLPGRPDFVFHRVKLAVFVHGCFWHLCRTHYKAPAGEGFRAKMDRNRRRDIRVRRKLRAKDWSTMVVWEHEDADKAAARIGRRIELLAQLQAVAQRLRGKECPELGGRCTRAACVGDVCEEELPF